MLVFRRKSAFSTSAYLIFFSLVSFVSAGRILKRDVFVPPVTYPKRGTVWKVGQRQNVTWDVSSPPDQITNPTSAMIVLSKDGILQDLGFNILDGTDEITVPNVATGSDYAIVLFGDSGNASPGGFTITDQRLVRDNWHCKRTEELIESGTSSSE